MEEVKIVDTFLCTMTTDDIKTNCQYSRFNEGKLVMLNGSLICKHKHSVYNELGLHQCECDRISPTGVIRGDVLKMVTEPIKKIMLKRKGKLLFKELQENKSEDLLR
jgi:hypothetical protein